MLEEAFFLYTGLHAPGREPVTPLTDTPLDRAKQKVREDAFKLFARGWKAALAATQKVEANRAELQKAIPDEYRVCPECDAKVAEAPLDGDSEIKCLQCDYEAMAAYDEDAGYWYWL